MMQPQTGPPGGQLPGQCYLRPVPRKVRADKGPRPAQGARLLALRRAAGLTQIELGKALGTPHANIAFWEWSEKPPRSDLLPLMAKVLGVHVEDILGSDSPGRRRAGPVGKLERVLEEARALPRRDQDLVVKFVSTLVEQHRKAG